MLFLPPHAWRFIALGFAVVSMQCGLIAAPLADNQIIRGPFLQNASPGSMQVAWKTYKPSDSVVEYGLTPSLGSRTGDTQWTQNHLLTLEPLRPGYTYYYRITSADSNTVLQSPIFSFRAAPTNGPVRVAVIGDSGGGSLGMGLLALQMAKWSPDLIVHLGDTIDPGLPSDSTLDAHFFRPFERVIARTPFYTVLGNHELAGDDYAQPFLQFFSLPTNSVTGTEIYYSFDYGDIHFASITESGTNVVAPNSPMVTWLTNDLAVSDKPWKILGQHYPAATSGSRYLQVTYNNLNLLKNLSSLAHPFGLDLLMNGHDHNTQRFAPTNGLHHVVSGSGGGNSYPFYQMFSSTSQFWEKPGFIILDVHGDTLSLQTFGTDGLAFDRMTIHRALAQDHPRQAAWHSPIVETSGSSNGDSNLVNQTFDLIGSPAPARQGDFSNLGRIFVNNDATNLYIGLDQVMIYPGQTIFLFVEIPGLPGVRSMQGLGDGVIGNASEGADGLDALEQISFDAFSPTIACVLGNEQADAQDRFFRDTAAPLASGQGVFFLSNGLPDVPGIRLQQFHGSPQMMPKSFESQESHADFIEVAIPLDALGNPQPGQTIKVAGVVALHTPGTNGILLRPDTSAFATRFLNQGDTNILLGGIPFRMAFPNDSDRDNDGLSDNWELEHGLNPQSSLGNDGAEGDPDGDGLNNARELAAGTNPQLMGSSVQMSIDRPDATHVSLHWTSLPGARYVLEYADGIPAGFRPLGSEWPRLGRGSEEVVVDDISDLSAPRFYRLILSP